MNGFILKPGNQVTNRYTVLEFIGSGGMQEVYRSRDSVLERDVALKVPKNSASERRFKRSAVVSARVNHPNAAKTLDYFEEDGHFYLVEELIGGADLKKIRQRIPMMDPYLVAHIMHHLAKGVAASHHVGVVHRDLKPSNIMASGDFSFEVIKITDFGIAKMAEEELTDAVKGGNETITSSHTMMGALPYLSPEMVRNPKKAQSPADVWAIGAMAYELLSGKAPFGKGLPAVPLILKGDPPELPQEVSSKIQFTALGNELYSVILACLQVDPKARPTADQLVQMCSRMCYPDCHRQTGVVTMRKYTFGFISSGGGQVFFNVNSVYGPVPDVGATVCFASYPGNPRPRAHPVVALDYETAEPEEAE